MRLRYILLLFVVLQTTTLLAQKNTVKPALTNNLDTPKTLSEVKIEVLAAKVPPTFCPTAITTGKKTDNISINSATANTITNNSRQAFGQVAGVHIWENDGSGLQTGVAVRGLSPNRSWEFNVRQNGMDISSEVFGYPEAYYQPPFQALDHVELIRGSAGLQYGAQIGGLLNYVTRKPSTKKLQYSSEQSIGTYGLLNTFNELSGTHGKWSYLSYFHYREAKGWRENSSYHTYNFHAQLGYQISNRTSVKAEYSQSYSLAKQAGGLSDSLFQLNPRQSNRARNWFEIPWKVATVTLSHKLNTDGIITLQASGIYGQRNSIGFLADANLPDNLNQARQVDKDNYENHVIELRYKQPYKLFQRMHTVAAGTRYYKGNTNRMQRGTGTSLSNFDLDTKGIPFNLDLSFQTTNLAAFVENQFQLTNKLSIVPGARLESVQSQGNGYTNLATASTTGKFTSVNPQKTFLLTGIGFDYKLDSQMNFYGNISQSYRPVLFSDFTQNSANSIQIDPDLKPTSSITYELGCKGSLGSWVNFDVTAFALVISDKVGTYNKSENNKTTQVRGNIGTAIHKGIELNGSIKLLESLHIKQLGRLTISSNLSLLDARYVSFENNSALATNQNIEGNWVENAPAIIQRNTIDYAYKWFSTSITMSSVSESYSNANNTQFTSSGSNGKIPAYQVLDLSFSVQFNKSFYISASINNATDNKYFTRRATGYPGPGLIPADGRTATLTLGIKI